MPGNRWQYCRRQISAVFFIIWILFIRLPPDAFRTGQGKSTSSKFWINGPWKYCTTSQVQVNSGQNVYNPTRWDSAKVPCEIAWIPNFKNCGKVAQFKRQLTLTRRRRRRLRSQLSPQFSGISDFSWSRKFTRFLFVPLMFSSKCQSRIATCRWEHNRCSDSERNEW